MRPTPLTDNVSELTARTNDEGGAGIFEGWLRVSRLRTTDTVLVCTVGGGNLERRVRPNLVAARRFAKAVGCKIIGIVGRDGGFSATVADACVFIGGECYARDTLRGGVSGGYVAPDDTPSRFESLREQM